jgi:hypothetical protein
MLTQNDLINPILITKSMKKMSIFTHTKPVTDIWQTN